MIRSRRRTPARRPSGTATMAVEPSRRVCRAHHSREATSWGIFATEGTEDTERKPQINADERRSRWADSDSNRVDSVQHHSHGSDKRRETVPVPRRFHGSTLWRLDELEQGQVTEVSAEEVIRRARASIS